jgi:predicted adenine nucleotide alpha hydrolase (AANH) superfamily ATPase
VVKTLVERFEVTGFFYGPNIHPREEHELRKSEAQRLAETYGFPLLTGEYDVERWHASVEGLEGEKEGGKRCDVCYRERLSRAAETARDEGCDFLASTLTVSPHKKASIINPIGEEEAARFGVRFYAADFKKKDGFKKSCRISRELGLYRQNYCGCIYSMRQDILL